MLTWAPYKPSPAAPWNLQRVVHLHRRAAFGATWPQIQRDLEDGPEAAISRLLSGQTQFAGAPPEFDSLSAVIGQAAADSGSPERLKAWWLYRCLFTPHPLQERLTLLWHNHFATSNIKVDDLKLMKGQNECLRKFALAPFGDLLRNMAHDPALLQWLDAPQNRAGHPNENLARESMELFHPRHRPLHRARRQRSRPRPHRLDHPPRRISGSTSRPRRRRKGNPRPRRQMDR